MKALLLSSFLLAGLPALAVTTPTTPSQSTFETISDLNAVLALMKGEVDMYGDQFGSVAFQRGILTLAQAKAIKVRVLTSPASLANLRPLKAVGAKLYTLDSKFTGSMVIVRGKAIIIPNGTRFNVLRTPASVGQVQAMMEQYWPIAKPN